MYDVKYHNLFFSRIENLAELAEENSEMADWFGQIMALVNALAEYGHDLEGYEGDAPSHPIVTSRYQMFALRRTPPTRYTPLATKPPIIRIPYVWFTNTHTNQEFPYIMLIGDKTDLSNDWYPGVVDLIETKLIKQIEDEQPHLVAQRKIRHDN